MRYKLNNMLVIWIFNWVAKLNDSVQPFFPVDYNILSDHV